MDPESTPTSSRSSPVRPFRRAATSRDKEDTVRANPLEVTTIRAKFDVPDFQPGTTKKYVYHCHILEHEENEMMRPFTVV